jgi:hypothetical protein
VPLDHGLCRSNDDDVIIADIFLLPLRASRLSDYCVSTQNWRKTAQTTGKKDGFTAG